MSVEGPERFTGGCLRRLARRQLQPNSCLQLAAWISVRLWSAAVVARYARNNCTPAACLA